MSFSNLIKGCTVLIKRTPLFLSPSFIYLIMGESQVIDDFVEAGKIIKKVREMSRKLIMVDAPVLDIAETIEEMIRNEGAKPAFPANISINSIAAHYTPDSSDKTVIEEGDIVKVDLGANVNGALSDTAYTIDLSGEYGKLVEASERALENAIATIKPGVMIKEVSEVIEKTIRSFGFKPISNLTGHKIMPGLLHAGVDVPNVKTNNRYVFKEGDIFAIEPFASTGSGFVGDMDQVEIFSLYQPKPLRCRMGKQIIDYILSNYGLLPFAQRWLEKVFSSRLSISTGLKEMIQKKVVVTYPVLKDTGNGIVSQTEHTILVENDGARVLT
jgi:methionyl aminopeptidase